MCEGSKAEPDFHIRSITTAIFRATATRAFDRPTFFESSSPQVCKALFDFVDMLFRQLPAGIQSIHRGSPG